MRASNGWFLFACLTTVSSGTGIAAEIERITLNDAVTGLSISVPASWQLHPTEAIQLRRVAQESERGQQNQQTLRQRLLFLATEPSAPGVPASNATCSIAPWYPSFPLSVPATNASVKMIVEQTLTLQYKEQGHTVSDVETLAVDGFDTFRSEVTLRDGAGGVREVVLLKNGYLVQCRVGYTVAQKDVAIAILASIRFAPPPARDGRARAGDRAFYRKLGCERPVVHASQVAAARDRGTPRQAIIDTIGMVHSISGQMTGVELAPFTAYMGQMIDDVYSHPALTEEDAWRYAYEHCAASIAGKEIDSVSAYEMKLVECRVGDAPAMCYASVVPGSLLKGR